MSAGGERLSTEQADRKGNLAASGTPSERSDRLEILRPDDWHLHLRDGEMLRHVLPYTAACFGRAVVMPNLDPPVTTVAQADAYRDRIHSYIPADSKFKALMTLYLTEETTLDEIRRAADSPSMIGVKLYPKGATTNSAAGVKGLGSALRVLEMMEKVGLPLLIHGESTDPAVDVFDREDRFLEEVLIPLVERHVGLRIVFEHITTASAAAFVADAPDRIGATITPQHLLLNRNAIFEGGLRPHHYCLPVLKRERDREALISAATSGNPRFFLGTDSAPHSRLSKESSCGCAGIFSAPVAIEAYAEAFARVGRLDRLEGFASRNGAAFYGLPENDDTIVLRKGDWKGPNSICVGSDSIEVFGAGESFQYRLESQSM